MHHNAPKPTASWPAAPTAGAALLDLLTRSLESAGNRAQRLQAPRLQLEEFQPSTRAAIAAALEKQNQNQKEAA